MPQTNAEQRKAHLKWIVACEHLQFALDPPQGSVTKGVADLAAAIEQAREALTELEKAFGAGTEPLSSAD